MLEPTSLTLSEVQELDPTLVHSHLFDLVLSKTLLSTSMNIGFVPPFLYQKNNVCLITWIAVDSKSGCFYRATKTKKDAISFIVDS